MSKATIATLIKRGIIAPELERQAVVELHMALKARLRRTAYDLVDASITAAAIDRLGHTAETLQ